MTSTKQAETMELQLYSIATGKNMIKYIKDKIYCLPKLNCEVKFIKINKTYSIDLFEFIVVNGKHKDQRLILCNGEAT